MIGPSPGRIASASFVVTLCALAAVACNSSQESNAMTTTPTVYASRLPPPDVAPVTIGGVTYRQMAGTADSEMGQVGGLLGAYDASGKRLWWIKVYDNRRRDDLEGDVQDVFFASMTVDAGGLLVVNESGKRFHVDVVARTSTPVPSEPKAKSPDDEAAIPL